MPSKDPRLGFRREQRDPPRFWGYQTWECTQGYIQSSCSHFLWQRHQHWVFTFAEVWLTVGSQSMLVGWVCSMQKDSHACPFYSSVFLSYSESILFPTWPFTNMLFSISINWIPTLYKLIQCGSRLQFENNKSLSLFLFPHGDPVPGTRSATSNTFCKPHIICPKAFLRERHSTRLFCLVHL